MHLFDLQEIEKSANQSISFIMVIIFVIDYIES
jgi:hypothetical protein